MPIVVLDTNVVDRFARAISDRPEADDANRSGPPAGWGEALGDAMEALEPPPVPLDPEALAAFWLVALAACWPGCSYVLIEGVYEELLAMGRHKPAKLAWINDLPVTVLLQGHPGDLDTTRRPRPDPASLVVLGLKSADAGHVADAVALGASHFLTEDRVVLGRAGVVRERYGLNVATPTEFLHDSVRRGAPWPARVPWPWE